LWISAERQVFHAPGAADFQERFPPFPARAMRRPAGSAPTVFDRTQNSYLPDGIDKTSLSQEYLTNQASYVYGPSPDAIAEFRVQTNLDERIRRSGGAVMNVNIKSGTNDYHGSVFEFLRNNALDARNFFAPA
jgi:hypothetical protein